jgi:hypothetical protein
LPGSANSTDTSDDEVDRTTWPDSITDEAATDLADKAANRVTPPSVE